MAKKMKLITEGEYLALQNNDIPANIAHSSFQEKTKLGGDLLHLDSVPDDIKLALYSSIVRNMHEKLVSLTADAKTVHVSTPMTNPVTSTNDEVTTQNDDSESAMDELITGSLPSYVQRPASIILKYLKRVPGLISWNSNGECSFNGVTAHESNIVDLLSYVLRPSLKINPTGLGRFLYTLRVTNLPNSILGHKIRLEMQRTNTDQLRQNVTPSVSFQNNEEETSDTEVFGTPSGVVNSSLTSTEHKKRRQGQNWEQFRTTHARRHSDSSPFRS